MRACLDQLPGDTVSGTTNDVAAGDDGIASRLSAYIANALAHPLPGEVLDRVGCHLLDSLAAMISGSRLRPGRLAARVAETLGGPAEATVAGTPLVVSAVHAALANGMAAHADETDDSHLAGRFHPGCAIVPAALAMAERNRRSGAQLLRAVALGYDIGARATLALGFSGPRTGTHSTHSLGALFGASAAAGALAGLDARQCRYLLSYTVQQASGIPYWQRDPEHVEKSFDFGGMGARNGVYAALMVAAGCTGVENPFSGPHNYLSAFAENARPGELVAGLGERWEILAASTKKWCVGSPIQAALDSLTALMTEHGIRAVDIESLTAHMPDDRLTIVDDRDMPDVCLQHLLAVTLIDGSLDFASSHDEARMHDPAVLALRKRIRALPSSELTVARPARQAIVEIHTRDGRHLSHRTRAVLGTPDNPMTPAQVQAKALELVAPVLGASRAQHLVEAVVELGEQPDVAALAMLLRA